MPDPDELARQDEPIFEGIRHFYIAVEEEEWKLDRLCDLYETVTNTQSIIFCNTKLEVDWLAEKMHSREFAVSAKRRGMSRQVSMKEFHSGSSRMLITTTVSRKTEVQQMLLVVNYSLPFNKRHYRRIVLGGRLGQGGIAISFVTTKNIWMLRRIERFYNIQIDKMPPNIA